MPRYYDGIDLSGVLIETLWNVKEAVQKVQEMLPGFNRNIVECKVANFFD